MKNVFAFGDECSDISDCNSDSCDCYGSDKEYLRTRVRRVDGNIILTRLKFLQNRRRKFMPISATTKKNITKQNKQHVVSFVSLAIVIHQRANVLINIRPTRPIPRIHSNIEDNKFKPQ